MRLILCCIAAVGCGAANRPPDADDVRSVVAGDEAFAFDLYHRLALRDGNLFFSPYSVSTALAMTYGGARGKTAEEIATVLHFPTHESNLHAKFGALMAITNHWDGAWLGSDAAKFQLVAANALWAQDGFPLHQEYLDLTRKHYEAGLRTVDFRGSPEKARDTINAWVAGKTRERIPELFGPGSLTPDVALVLTNAVYFLADWAKPFPKSLTRPEAFHTPGGDVTTPLMNDHREADYMETDRFQAIRLPYKGGPEMIVFLPRVGLPLAEFEKSFTAETLRTAIDKWKVHSTALTFPKFTLRDGFELSGELAAMGMPSSFDAGADFSGVTSQRPLFIAKIVHKTFVAVDETKTEAAAATGVSKAPRSMAAPSKPHAVFRADRPFVFVLRDPRTESILFIGRIVQPKAG